jgi:hypothetical protein
MISLILAVALHLGGDAPGGSTYCGTGTSATADSQGNTACVASAPAVAPQVAPAAVTPAPVILAEPAYNPFGFGFGRGFGRFHR